jgi:hypothetical protein
VLGVGGVTAAGLGVFETGGDSASTADSSAEGADDGAGAGAGGSAEDGGAAESAPGTADSLPQVRADTFAADVAGLLSADPALAPPGKRDALRQVPDNELSATCPGPPVPAGVRATVVRLDAEPAVLLVHPVRGAGRLVEAWSCDGRGRLASTTLTR